METISYFLDAFMLMWGMAVIACGFHGAMVNNRAAGPIRLLGKLWRGEVEE